MGSRVFLTRNRNKKRIFELERFLKADVDYNFLTELGVIHILK